MPSSPVTSSEARTNAPEVPPALRHSFILHFVADWLFAIPLFFFPEAFLSALGWARVDTVTARIVAAALVGIGTQSLLERHSPLARYENMLSLKCLWSATASLGLLWEVIAGAPAAVAAFLGIFVSFNVLWTYWLLRVRALLR